MSENVAPPVPQPSAPVKKARLASSLVAAGIFLSKIAGLVRDRVLANYFGVSLYADAITAGLRMPNLLQNLLGEGTLSASFIPVYAELLEEGKEEEAGRVAGAVFALLMAVAGVLALLGVLLAPMLTDIFAPGYEGERRQLTIELARLIFPMTGVLVLSAWALGILNSHRNFFLPYFAPVIWNAAIIATLVTFGGRLDSANLVRAFGWGALAGGILQFVVQLPAVLRLEKRLKIRWDTKLKGVRDAVRNAGPAIMGRGVVQLSGYIDFILASLLALGTPALLRYASAIYMLPIGIFGMSVAAAELPELARHRASAQEVLAARASAALRRIAFYIVPSFVAIVALGDVMIAGLFETGEFDPNDTRVAYLALVGYGIGLIASTASRLFSSTFFALRDTKTPARIAMVRVAVSAVLGAFLMIQFEPVTVFGVRMGPGIFSDITVGQRPLGVVGLTAAAGVSAWLEWFLLRRALRQRVGPVGAGVGPMGKMLAAAVAAAAVGWAVRGALPEMNPTLRAVLVFAPFGVVYFGLAAVLGVEEIAGVKTRVQRLLKR
ncbi:MAG: murein biosynthesis integral membrane protein MurJ [Gemmatimonadetes bacterium]|nr:murein biosynthesis integral membrane protein MurJ [Gemmatimonadota bacterium]